MKNIFENLIDFLMDISNQWIFRIQPPFLRLFLLPIAILLTIIVLPFIALLIIPAYCIILMEE